jgi:hypothetical protein
MNNYVFFFSSLLLAAILLFKSRFFTGFILAVVGFSLIFIALLSWFLARNNKKQQQKLKKTLPGKTSVEKPLISTVKETIPTTETNGIIPSSPPIEQTNKPPSAIVHISHSPQLENKLLTPSIIRQAILQGGLTRESSIATDDDDDGLNNFLRHHQALPPVPTKIDEEYEERFSLKMNKSEEYGLGSLINGTNTDDLALSHSHAVFYQPDYQTGLIKPLSIRKEPPQRYTKYVSSCSKFVLPRPVKSSSSAEYQQR